MKFLDDIDYKEVGNNKSLFKFIVGHKFNISFNRYNLKKTFVQTATSKITVVKRAQIIALLK